jgi:hypothetical protein
VELWLLQEMQEAVLTRELREGVMQAFVMKARPYYGLSGDRGWNKRG